MSVHETGREPACAGGSSDLPPAKRAPPWIEPVCAGYLFYLLTTLPVLFGVVFGADAVTPCRRHPAAEETDYIGRCAVWDGQWYNRIAAEGYFYEVDSASSVAFFPAYPWLSRGVARVFALRGDEALLIVSHAFLAGAFVLLAAYVRRRCASDGARLSAHVLLAFGLFPTTLYFRMAYSESMFVFFAILSMYGMARRWHSGCIALVVGVATATRPVGVALLLPLAIDLWKRSTSAPAVSWRGRAANACLSALVLLLSCWGILAYMAYLKWTFDEPLAFAKTQAHWRRCEPPATLGEKVWGLATLKPIREIYRPGGPCHWARDPPADRPLCNGTFLNPIYFLFTAGAVAAGAAKGWLNSKEWAFSAALLAIPYVASGDSQCMAGEMRFSSAVFPLYIVLGHLLCRVPAPMAAVLPALSAVMLSAYTALFTSWYWFY